MALKINDTAAFRQYTATGGQTVFAVPFEFFENADLKVYQNTTLLTLITHYTVTGAGIEGGGNVTLVTGAALGDTITIVRDVAVKRVTDFPASGPFQIESLNDQLARLTAMIQQQETVLNNRVFKLGDFDTPGDVADLPAKASRANQFLAFDALGNPIVSPGSAGTGSAFGLAVAAATPTLSVDQGAAFNDAFASGAEEIIIGPGEYLAENLVIPSGGNVRKIRGVGDPVIQISSAPGAIALDIQQLQHVEIEGVIFRCGPEADTGTAQFDGNGVIGIRTAWGGSYLTFTNVQTRGFSGAGIQLRQTVDVTIQGGAFRDCRRGREYLPNPSADNAPCSVVRVIGNYGSGCDEGDYSENGITAFWFAGNNYEYCRNDAIRVRGGWGVEQVNYFETNGRNKWFWDCQVSNPGKGVEMAATNPDVIGWTGAAGAVRGYSQLDNRTLTITDLSGDTTTGGTLNLLSDIGVGGAGTAGLIMHIQRAEPRARIEATSASGKYFELVSGGGSSFSEGFFFLAAEAGGNRIIVSDDLGEGIRIIGSGAGAELWVGGSKVLGQRKAALPADATDLASVITLANEIKARLKVTGGMGIVED